VGHASAEDVAALGLAEGERVRIVSRRGSVEAPVRVGRGLRPGLVFMTKWPGSRSRMGVPRSPGLLDGPRPPGAVFAAAARPALGALVEARRRRLSVPGDIALAGYTDIESAQLVDPPLTMVNVPAHEAGVRAMETLVDLIAGRRVAPRRHVLGVELVVRGSCGQH
jgi:DNA-binding LacI/PurR family transcriptional regulator